MDWNTFVEALKIFWNQPVPIIGFTIGTLIIGVLFIVGKTSIGKKALNKIKKINDELTEKLQKAEEQLLNTNEKSKKFIDECKKELNEFKETADFVIKNKEEEIKQLKDEYELKLTSYKEQLLKQAEIIKVICENSINKNIKEAYEKYVPEELDLPISKLKIQIEEKVKTEYDDRLKALEQSVKELVYGERKETTND